MLCVEPFAVKNELAAQHHFQNRTLYRGPLLEQVVLWMHALSDLVPATLKHHAARSGEMNAYVRAVQLLFHDERRIGDKRLRVCATEMLVVVRSLRAE